MQETTLNREELLERTRKEDERSDLKQHADKMLRDFEKFNKFSSNRAIWELVQNACDLSVESEIIIDYRNDCIAFTHNGKPFTSKSLISLIKQVSGKYGDQEDIPEVGKYGTGFLTTHTFGRKFKINSVLQEGEYYLPIKDFEIDRSPKTWELLSDNIASQKKRVYKILENENPVQISEFKTTFTYTPESEIEKEYIRISSLDLDEYIPLVFTVNDRLKKITVYYKDGSEKAFIKTGKERVDNDKGVNLFKTRITDSFEEKWIYSLIDEKEAIEIILPIDKQNKLFTFSDRIARLFLYYPLVGSENFGINFLINCNHFLPNEPRSGIHLNSNKEQVKEQEEANRLVIQKCTEIIFDFLKSNVIEVDNPLLYSDVKFNTKTDDGFLNEYFEKLQSHWNEEFGKLPFVKTASGYIEIEKAAFLDKELIVDNEEDLKTIYSLVSRYYDNVPVLENILQWSTYAVNWNDDNIQFIDHQDILSKIKEEKLSDFNSQELIAYYSYLLSLGKSSIFNDVALLPNINGDFHKLGHLLEAADLDDQLLSFGQVLIPGALEHIIHEDFKFNFDLSHFNRRDYSDKVKLMLDERKAALSIYLKESLALENYHEDLISEKDQLEEEFFIALLNFCKLTNNVNSTSKPNQLLKIISKYYGEEDALLHFPSITDENKDIDKRSIRRTVVQIFLNLIGLHQKNWVKDNLELIAEICSLEEDSYKEVYKSSKIYPNQLFELCLIEDIKRDNGVWEDIKDIFLKVKGKDINEELSIATFNDFIPEDQYVVNRYLTTQIEDLFFENTVTEIEEHPFKDVIISIIPKLTKKSYQELFPQLDSKKANIMISVVTNEERKDDIFAIVTLKDDKLKKLGEFVRNENFLELLDKAVLLAVEEQNKHIDFEHKYAIGTYIENKIREKLNNELKDKFSVEKVSSDNVQGGQDIIIRYNGEDVHYIEVKSRWDNRNSITMSKLQLERAAISTDMYSLCSVDVSTFYGEGDKYKLNIEQIIPLTKFGNHIGQNIKPLVEHNLSAEKNTDEKVHLIEYRGIIPQAIIKEGSDFDNFILYLSNKIQIFSENAITN